MLCCARQACESPLLVAVAAGSVALPTLLKLAAVMAGQSQDFENCTQIPVELELGSEFVFQSVFACPVSREQARPPHLIICADFQVCYELLPCRTHHRCQ